MTGLFDAKKAYVSSSLIEGTNKLTLKAQSHQVLCQIHHAISKGLFSQTISFPIVADLLWKIDYISGELKEAGYDTTVEFVDDIERIVLKISWENPHGMIKED